MVVGVSDGRDTSGRHDRLVMHGDGHGWWWSWRLVVLVMGMVVVVMVHGGAAGGGHGGGHGCHGTADHHGHHHAGRDRHERQQLNAFIENPKSASVWLKANSQKKGMR